MRAITPVLSSLLACGCALHVKTPLDEAFTGSPTPHCFAFSLDVENLAMEGADDEQVSEFLEFHEDVLETAFIDGFERGSKMPTALLHEAESGECALMVFSVVRLETGVASSNPAWLQSNTTVKGEVLFQVGGKTIDGYLALASSGGPLFRSSTTADRLYTATELIGRKAGRHARKIHRY